MKANFLIAAGFIVLAGVLTFLSWKGVIKNSALDRVEKAGSIGLMVIKLVPGGNFEASGVQAGDVIIALNGEVANDPMEVASALLQTGPLLVTIVRDGQRSILPIDGGTSAGAGLSQLIVLNAVQL